MLPPPLLLNGSTSHQYRRAGGGSRLRIWDCELRIAFLKRHYPSAVVRWYTFPSCAFPKTEDSISARSRPPETVVTSYRGGACINRTATMLPKNTSSTIPRPINIPFRTGSLCSFWRRNGDSLAKLESAATGFAVWTLVTRPFSILPKSSWKFSILVE